MQAGEHLTDEQCSALIDAQLAPDEAVPATLHLATCRECQASVHQMRDLAALLRSLPSLEPPRDFRLVTEPRARLVAVAADSPRVIRLRRWYTATRIGAASLAAAFVLASIGSLYVESRTPTPTASVVAQGRTGPAAENAAPAAVRSAAPGVAAAAAQPSVGPAPGASGAQSDAKPQSAIAPARAQPVTAPRATPGDATDQQAAATSAQALPTQLSTPLPQPGAGLSAAVAASQAPSTQVDGVAPLRTAAILVGLLAAFSLLAALVLRRRLRAASHLASE